VERVISLQVWSYKETRVALVCTSLLNLCCIPVLGTESLMRTNRRFLYGFLSIAWQMLAKHLRLVQQDVDVNIIARPSQMDTAVAAYVVPKPDRDRNCRSPHHNVLFPNTATGVDIFRSIRLKVDLVSDDI
jgi:hypothetical protein